MQITDLDDNKIEYIYSQGNKYFRHVVQQS